MKHLFSRLRARYDDWKKTTVAEPLQPDWRQIASEAPPAWLPLVSWSALLLFIVLLLWAAISRVETTVVARGELVSLLPNTPVQPLYDGIVRQLSVSEGDFISEGEVLAVLDSTESEADLDSIRLRLLSAQASARRFEAELAWFDNRDEEEVEPVAVRLSDDPAMQSLEQQLFIRRINEYRGTIALHAASMQALQQRQVQLAEQLQMLEQEVVVTRELDRLRTTLYEKEKEAYQRNGPRKVDHLQTRQTLLAAERNVATVRAELKTIERHLTDKEIEHRAWRTSVLATLSGGFSQSSRDYVATLAQLKKYEQAQKTTSLRAPHDAIVLISADKGAGSVVKSGEVLFELARVNGELEAEIMISPMSIGMVAEAANVRLKLDTLPFTRYGDMSGTLRLISNGTVLDNQEQLGYRGNVRLESRQLRHLPEHFRLLPGMTLEADILTGERSLLSFLIYPIERALDNSFREP
ncbi:HlyD family type I secretion periplasmic adaptor subunit [Kistimonas asteriae]|uniref:HlyD family type I secretion periplasmic adaptor subunit n=1 Tax=Kistimonas asteriae TaxID=517724 RepID=UPI001BADB9D9|nr:HlyD family type I secretion periplasmic adaptor subunit [Kistimonas asteriae]